MRNVSKKFKEAMETRRDFYAVGEITFADGTQKTISKEDFSQTGNSIVDSAGSTSFPLGMLIPKQITISLMNDDDRWSEYDFYWATIHLMTKFDFDDGTTESLNIGTFTVISPENYGTTIEITAMDDSYKTDKPYDTKYTYPMSMGIALQDCCETCGITLFSQNFANRDYEIPKKPENLTHRQFIGLCAMIAGGNARFDEYNRLKIISYNFSPLENLLLDGGSFNPWTEGDSYDGGTFNPWTTGTVIDAGTFDDRDNIHVLYQYKSGIVIEVDDVVITGVQMSGDDGEGNETTYLYGEQGYVLAVDNQLAEGKENEVLRLIGDKVIGMTFRPFSGDHIALPTAEFMDLAYVIDRKQNIYKSVLTDVTFNFYGFTNLKCSADSPIRNSSTKLGNDVKAIVEAKKLVEREKTARERAIENLANQLAQGNGLYMTTEVQEDKSTIYYMHNKPSLAESMIVWKLAANALGISTDGGKTYPYGLDVTGVAILERIYAIGLNADYITTGAFEIRNDDGTVLVLMNKDTKEVILRPTRFELSDGSSIEQTVEKAAGDKAKTFLSQPTPPYHKGDLWYGGTSSDVKVCVNTREAGQYNASDWQKQDRYVDSATASAAGTSAANTAIQNMTQTQVLDKLTNGGKDKGIYLQNGQLYISFSAMRGGELTLGGKNNGNGILKVVNLLDDEVGRFDNEGLTLTRGTIEGPNITVGGSSTSYGIFQLKNASGTVVSRLSTNMNFLTVGTRKSGTSYSNFSIAFGSNVEASESYACAFGMNTAAKAIHTFVAGNGAIAKAMYSQAFGTETIAAYQSQMVVGKYNAEDSSGSFIFIVGNGDSYGRENAFAVGRYGGTYVGKSLRFHWDGFTTDTDYTAHIDCNSTGELEFHTGSGAVYLTDDNFHSAGKLELGESWSPWGQIYSTNSTISSSDRNEKKNIENINPGKATEFLMSIRPVTYKYIDGTSDRTHWGMISQDVEETLNDLGMSTKDFAGFIKSPKKEKYIEDGIEKTRINEEENTYGLRYEEFIAPLISVVQSQQKKIQNLEERLARLEELLEVN